MATGRKGNINQLQQGYGSGVWGTGRVTAGPPGPGATQRLSLAGAVENQDKLNQNGRRSVCCDDEDNTQSPSVSVQRVHDKDDTEVMLSSRWQQHASAGEQDQAVTQLAAHSISDGRQKSALHEDFREEGTGAVAQSLSQSWQAGDVIGSVRTTADLLISMVKFNNRRTVTVFHFANPWNGKTSGGTYVFVSYITTRL